MAKGTQGFTIQKSKDEVYRFLSDPTAVGSCLSFVKETENENGLHWRMKSPMSTITSTKSLALEFEAHPTDEVSWRGQGDHLQSRGQIVLNELKERETEVDITMEMTGLGPMSIVIEPLASVQIANQIDYFSACVREKLESGG
jgi:carbon monoxide dehydrogenase subunit G